MNNRIYRPTLRKGTRIRVLDTGELGTIADKMLIRKDGTVRTYCKVRLDKKPKEDTWYFAERLGGTSATATAIFADEGGRTLRLTVTKHYDMPPGSKDMHAVLDTSDGSLILDHRDGLHFYLAAFLLENLYGGESGE